jgi:hypothetical protein
MPEQEKPSLQNFRTRFTSVLYDEPEKIGNFELAISQRHTAENDPTKRKAFVFSRKKMPQ